MKKTDLAYAAGVIDGEGSIGLYDYGKEGRRVCIQLSNTHKEFVEKFRETINCGSQIKRMMFNKGGHKGRKPIYYYSLKGSNRCYWILKQIFPYLIIKKKKVLNIIKELEEKPFGRWANATQKVEKSNL